LKGVSVGGGAQYRQPTYLGNFDLNRDGVAEQLFTPSYTLVNLSLGYRTQLWNRRTDFGLVINNLLGKKYYRALALGSGAWGEPRDFRLTIRVEL
jgi:outer membrane receptor protein involved in Fe transport